MVITNLRMGWKSNESEYFSSMILIFEIRSILAIRKSLRALTIRVACVVRDANMGHQLAGGNSS